MSLMIWQSDCMIKILYRHRAGWLPRYGTQIG
jgi:hypothetical protein